MVHFMVNLANFDQIFCHILAFFLDQESSKGAKIFFGASLSPSQSFEHHITVKKLN